MEGAQSHSNHSPTGSSSTLRVPSKTTLTSSQSTETQDFEPSSNSYHSVSSVEYSIDPESMKREMERNASSQQEKDAGILSENDYSISSVQGETIDDSYYLIDTHPQEEEASFPVGIDNPGSVRLDVNALASKLAALEGDREVMGEGRMEGGRLSAGGYGRVGSEEVTEVVLDGGGVHKVSVAIEKTGTSIVWEFNTEPKWIAFGLYYKETMESFREEEVRPSCSLCCLSGLQ